MLKKVMMIAFVLVTGCVRGVRFIPEDSFVKNADSFYISKKFWRNIYTVRSYEEFKIKLKTGWIITKSNEIMGVKKENIKRKYVVKDEFHNIELKAELISTKTSLNIDITDNSNLELDIDNSIEMIIEEENKNIGSIVRFKNSDWIREKFLCLLKGEHIRVEIEKYPENYLFFCDDSLVSVIWKTGCLKYEGLISRSFDSSIKNYILPIFILSKELYSFSED